MSDYLQPHLDLFSKVVERFIQELKLIRSGRAAPSLIEQVKVEAYGTLTPLIELASITAPEPRLLVVQPWDKGIIKDIERSLQAANLGVSPVVDGTLLRLNWPALSEERRRELVKQVNVKMEEAKVGIRNAREEILKQFKADKTEGIISEDIFFSIQKELQKVVDKYNEDLKTVATLKEKEIMTI